MEKKTLKNTNVINDYWSDYDKTIAQCHISNWGTIYLDDYGYPMEVEEVINLLYY